ncbi:MAG: zinc-finger domain-containing protein [Proteobacteria bacterium]|nr:zinc-finger domain-containing protein [Pseudomonadota bacterium]
MARKAPEKPLVKPASGKRKPEPAPAKPALIPPLPAPEVITVRSKRVACDGVGGALGHPRVWLEMGEADFVECTYCDRRFVLAHGSEGAESELLAPGVYEGSHGH